MKDSGKVELLRSWTNELLAGLEDYSDEAICRVIMEKCGKQCALFHDDFSRVKSLRRKAKSFPQLLFLVNKYLKWCGEWKMEGGEIVAVGKGCECPLVKRQWVKLSPVLCLCSRGWVKTIFEEALGNEVEVDLVKSIGRGDDCCEFRVRPFPVKV